MTSSNGTSPRSKTARRIGAATVLAGASTGGALLAFMSPAAGVTTLTVDTLADGVAQASDCTIPVANSCSLRDALAAAGSGDTINFAGGLNGTITMDTTQGQLVMANNGSIVGPGRDNLTIDGQNGTRVFYIAPSVTTASISGLTFRDGNSGSAEGGGLHSNAGSLDITISGSAFVSNSAVDGGGLSVIANSAIFDDVVVADNSATFTAGGMRVISDTLVVSKATVTGNTSAYLAGGAYFSQRSNGAGGLTVSDSSFSTNSTSSSWTGGLNIRWGGTGAASVTSSTIAGNVGRGVLLRAEYATVMFANCTVTGNTSSSDGAGVKLYSSYSDMTIAQSTVSANTSTSSDPNAADGSGLSFYTYSGSNGSLTITGSIIAGNLGAGIHDLGAASPTSLPFSIERSILGSVSTNMVFTDGGGIIPNVTDPGLNALADNGGPTKTMSLTSSSPAIDAGPNPVATFPGNQFDQRGTGFARVSYGRVDIGAFEIQPPEPPTTTTSANGQVIPSFTG